MVKNNLYNRNQIINNRFPKFLIGDKVRISLKKKRIFEKEASANWSEEIFEVSDILMTNPIVYKLKDFSGTHCDVLIFKLCVYE